ncbi:MAG: SRPBCC family protein [Mucilaginibacter sp.]
MKNEPFVIERTYKAPINTVWEAITDKDKMKEWYFALQEFKPEVGFEFTFTGGTEENQYLHLCKITEVIPGKKLSHTWKYDGYTGESLVTFELFDKGEETTLRLTHAGLETFPPIKDFAKTNFEQGWTYIIGKSLLEYLEGKQD